MKISNETKVGVLTSLAITILILGYNFLKGKEIFTNTRNYYAIYPSTSGLQVSNPIILNGFNIGRVGGMTLTQQGKILVEIVVKEDFFIPANTVAKLRSTDFFGAKAIELELGNAKEEVSEGDTLLSEVEQGLAESLNAQVGPVKMKTESMLTTADSFLTTLQKLISPQFNANIQHSLENLNTTLNNLKVITENVESITRNIQDNNQRINNILQNTEGFTDSLKKIKINQTVDRTNKLLNDLNTITQKINKGEGTMGQLINNPDLYYRLDSTSRHLDELLIDLKKNPKHYVSFSVFGKKGK